jgi:hypothetical protein
MDLFLLELSNRVCRQRRTGGCFIFSPAPIAPRSNKKPEISCCSQVFVCFFMVVGACPASPPSTPPLAAHAGLRYGTDLEFMSAIGGSASRLHSFRHGASWGKNQNSTAPLQAGAVAERIGRLHDADHASTLAAFSAEHATQRTHSLVAMEFRHHPCHTHTHTHITCSFHGSDVAYREIKDAFPFSTNLWTNGSHYTCPGVRRWMCPVRAPPPWCGTAFGAPALCVFADSTATKNNAARTTARCAAGDVGCC